MALVAWESVVALSAWGSVVVVAVAVAAQGRPMESSWSSPG